MILGIVPAGGKAKRFDGCLKEMLPCGKDQLMIDRTISAFNLGGADKVLVLTTAEKIGIHAAHLGAGYDYRIGRDTLWHSIMEAFAFKADWYLFAMPDTYYPMDVFDHSEMHRTDFNIGWFETMVPCRFGVLMDGEILEKPKLGTGIYRAWGTLCWTNKVVDLWLNNLDKINEHTDAFNLAIKEFGYQDYKMAYYHDMATWEDYSAFIAETLC